MKTKTIVIVVLLIVAGYFAYQHRAAILSKINSLTPQAT